MIKDNPYKGFLYLDTTENAIDSLEMVEHFLKLEDDNKWKWVIIALFHSLYSFCIINLQGTSPDEVTSKMYDEDDEIYVKYGNDKWKRSKIINTKHGFGSYTITWEEIVGDPPIKKHPRIKKKKEKLIPFWTAIARVQSGLLWMGKLGFSKPIILSENEWKSVIWLHEIRNEIEHFIPKSILFSKDKFIPHFINCLNVIQKLVFETGQCYFHIDKEGDQSRIKQAIKKIRNKL